MLYLAEVQIQKGFMGNKTMIKLLACQRSEQNWSSVSEELIELAEPGTLKDGALVLVEVANKKIQRPPQDAARPLIGILQKFSTLQGKFEGQEEEIEQWKQSLTFQAQELNRREMELVAREDELVQLEEEAEKLEEKRGEIERLSEEAQRQREEFERKSQELEGAWAHLRGEQERLEELKGELSAATVLDDEKASQIRQSLQSLSEAVAPTETLREAVGQMTAAISEQQQVLDDLWQRLEESKGQRSQLEGEVNDLRIRIDGRWQEWNEAQGVLERAQFDLRTQESLLQFKRDLLPQMQGRLSETERLCEEIRQLSDAAGIPTVTVDRQALENMPIDELQERVGELEEDLRRASGFVRDQEEELRFQLEAIDELKQKIQQASEYDRLSLETELASEQESYDFLNESLVGSRRNLAEREVVFKVHESILRQRQGFPAEPGQEALLDFGPVLEGAQSQRLFLLEQVQGMEAEISQIQGAIRAAQELVNSQMAEQEKKRNQIKELEKTLAGQEQSWLEARGKVGIYEQMLQPLQDRLAQYGEKVARLQEGIGGIQSANDRQLQAIAQLQQTVTELTQ